MTTGGQPFQGIFMGYRFTKARTLTFLAITGLAVALAGCSTDRYLMVPKDGLEDVRATVKTQRATLVTMEENATFGTTSCLPIAASLPRPYSMPSPPRLKNLCARQLKKKHALPSPKTPAAQTG